MPQSAVVVLRVAENETLVKPVSERWRPSRQQYGACWFSAVSAVCGPSYRALGRRTCDQGDTSVSVSTYRHFTQFLIFVGLGLVLELFGGYDTEGSMPAKSCHWNAYIDLPSYFRW